VCEFSRVTDIHPEEDGDGNPKEYLLQARYAKAATSGSTATAKGLLLR
jgi:hypothetical protein